MCAVALVLGQDARFVHLDTVDSIDGYVNWLNLDEAHHLGGVQQYVLSCSQVVEPLDVSNSRLNAASLHTLILVGVR